MKVKKILKMTFFVFSAFLVLIGIAVVIIPILFDPNDYKVDIQSAVHKSSGRDLSIDGELSVSVFPWLGIETGKVSLSNRVGFDDHPFAQIEKANVRIKLLPLFSQQIQIDHIVFKGLQLNLTTNDSGVTNWSNFGNLQDNPSKQPIQIQSTNSNIISDETRKLQLANLMVSRITLEDARIIVNDRSTNQKTEFNNLNFQMEKFQFNDSVDFTVTSTVTTIKPKLDNTVSITGRLIVENNLDVAVIEHLHIQAQTTGNALNTATLNTDITAAVSLNLAKNTFTVFKLNLTLEDLALQSNLSGTSINDNPMIKGSVKIKTFNPKSFARRIGFDLPDLKDPDAFSTTNIAFDFSSSKSDLQLANIVAQIDQTEIKGAASVVDFDQALVKFNLDANRLNADNYLPTDSATGSEPNPLKPSTLAMPSTGTSPVKNQSAESTLTTISNLNVEGVLNIHDLQLHNIKAQDVRLVAKVKNGIIRTNQSIKNLYNGRYRGALEFNLQGPEPVLSVNERFTQIDLEPLLINLTGKAELAGKTDAKIRLTARGSNAKAIKNSLNGNIELSTTHGYVRGIDLLKIIRNTRSFIKPTPSQRSDASDKTKFFELNLTATVTNGLIHAKALNVKSQALEADGSGQIYLVNDTVDMKITANITGDPAGIAGIKIKELQGVPITIIVGGTLSQLSYRPDLKSVLKSPKIKKATKKLEKKLEEKLGPEIKNLLDSIF